MLPVGAADQHHKVPTGRPEWPLSMLNIVMLGYEQCELIQDI